MTKPILLVDDPQATLDELAEAVELYGYKPIRCPSDADAVEAFGDETAELVFVSLGHAESQGICERLRNDPDGAIVPIIFVGTGQEAVSSPAEALGQGGDFYFQHPLDIPAVMAKVRTYVGPGAGGGPTRAEPTPAPPDSEARAAPSLPTFEWEREPDIDDAASATDQVVHASDALLAEIKNREAQIAAARQKERQQDEARNEAQQTARKESEEKKRKRQEAEHQRKAEQEQRRREAQERKVEADAAARQKREAQERERFEAEVMHRAEAKIQQALAEEQKRRQERDNEREQQERSRREELEKKRKAEQLARRRAEADAAARQRAQRQARQEAEAQARQEAEAQARQEAEAQARQEAEAQARQEAEAQARAQEAKAEQRTQRLAERDAQRRARQLAEDEAQTPPRGGDLPTTTRVAGERSAAAAVDNAARSGSPRATPRRATRPTSERNEASAPRGELKSPSQPEGSFDAAFDIAMVLAALRRDGATGSVEFRSENRHKVVFFDSGLPVAAQSGQVFDRLEEYLAREGKITRAQYQTARVKQLRSARRLGAFLVTEGYLKPQELFSAVRGHLCEVVYGLFEWEEGTYRYAPQREDESDRIALRTSPAALIVEGIRRKYLMPRLIARIGGPSTLVGPVQGGTLEPAELGISGEERSLLRMVDGTRSIEDLVFTSGLSELQVYQVLATLTTLEYAEVLVRGIEGYRTDGSTAGDDTQTQK